MTDENMTRSEIAALVRANLPAIRLALVDYVVRHAEELAAGGLEPAEIANALLNAAAVLGERAVGRAAVIEGLERLAADLRAEDPPAAKN